MRHAFLIILLILTGSACVHTPVQRDALPAGAPSVTEVLADLTRPDRELVNFSSNGIARMQLPGEEGTQRFDRSHIRFQQPAQFFADIRKLGPAVRLYINGDAFLMELPSEKTFYYGTEGDRFDEIALDVAPSTVFHELFLVDTLAGLDAAQVALSSYDPDKQSAALEIYRSPRRRSLERRLVVENGPEGWRVTESELYDASGDVIGRTSWAEYAYLDGVYMPARVEVVFPGENASMDFEIRPQLLRANRQTPLEVDDVHVVREELLSEGYREICGAASGERKQ